MESVNLDMEDIFEEEAADDDFPTAGPLPDLPEEDGVDGGGDQDEDNADVMAKLKDLSKGAAKKVVRKPMPKLDSQRLTGERGIPILPKVFEKVQFKGKGHEGEDLRILMRYLEHWAHRLFPMMPFDEVLERIEKLGTKKEVQTCIKKMRLDMPLLNDEFVQQSDDEAAGSDGEKQQQNGKNVTEEEWDELIQEEEQRSTPPSTPLVSQLKSQLSKPLQDLSSPLYTATPLTGGLTPEQRERIERNKQIALQKKMEKQGLKVPAIQSSPFRVPQSPAPQRSPSVHSPSKVSPLKRNSLPATVSSPHNSQDSQAEMSEVIPNVSHPHNSPEASETEMSEVIPNVACPVSSQESQDMSEVIPQQHCTTDNECSPNKKSRTTSDLSEDHITSPNGD